MERRLTLLDRFKVRTALWAIEAFQDEKYKLRRIILMPIMRRKLDEMCKEVDAKMGEQLMENGKPKWQSKAFLAALCAVIVGAIQPISKAVGHPIVVPQWVIEVLMGIGLYGVRDAIGKDSKLQ